jgi:hypothetical protein
MRLAPKLSLSACLLLAAAAVSACKSAESKSGPGAPVAAAGGNDKVAVPGGDQVAVPGGDKVAVPGGADNGAKAPPPTGPVGDTGPDSSFKLTITTPPAKAGAETVAHVEVTPGTGYHVNQDFPTKLVITPADGVTLAKAELVKDDAQVFNTTKLAFDVKLTAARAGNFQLGGTLKFAVCTETTCDPKKRAIEIPVTVQ